MHRVYNEKKKSTERGCVHKQSYSHLTLHCTHGLLLRFVIVVAVLGNVMKSL